MAKKSEVYHWLKSLSPGMKLERLSVQFESRGFRSRRSLAYVKSEDLDSFFPSPDKLLLAERRVLEAELSSIRTESSRLEPKRLNMTQITSSVPQQRSPDAAINVSFEASATTSNQSSRTIQSPLDRRAAELSENLKLLEVQVESAKSHLQGKQKSFEELPNIHERRGKVCAICHTSGHNRTNCKKIPCNDVNTCKLKDKHPELLADIRTLQREVKELEQKFAKAKSDHDVFVASRQPFSSPEAALLLVSTKNRDLWPSQRSNDWAFA